MNQRKPEFNVFDEGLPVQFDPGSPGQMRGVVQPELEPKMEMPQDASQKFFARPEVQSVMAQLGMAFTASNPNHPAYKLGQFALGNIKNKQYAEYVRKLTAGEPITKDDIATMSPEMQTQAMQFVTAKKQGERQMDLEKNKYDLMVERLGLDRENIDSLIDQRAKTPTFQESVEGEAYLKYLEAALRPPADIKVPTVRQVRHGELYKTIQWNPSTAKWDLMYTSPIRFDHEIGGVDLSVLRLPREQRVGYLENLKKEIQNLPDFRRFPRTSGIWKAFGLDPDIDKLDDEHQEMLTKTTQAFQNKVFAYTLIKNYQDVGQALEERDQIPEGTTLDKPAADEELVNDLMEKYDISGGVK